MKKKLKRAGAALAALALCAAMMPAAFAAALNETIDNDSTTSDINSYTSAVTVTPSDITEGGKFRIEYSGDEANIVLVLSDQSGSGDHSWLAVSDKTATGTTEDGYYVEYAYDKLVTAWESDDFADLKGVRAATWGLWDSASGTTLVKSTTIKSIEWIAAEEITEPDGYKINFDSSDDIPAYTDERTIPEASEIKEGGKFRVVHTNSSANVVLAMTGTEKKHSWVNVSDKTTGTTEDGYAYAEFGYDAIVTAWESEDFSDYSYVRAQTWSEETIIISIEWIPAAETEGNTAPATEITGTFEDGSQGWTVEVDASALTSGAQWVITNSDNETAEFDAVIEPSVEGNVRIGLVLTETAIGDNTITGVSLKY